MKISLLMLTAMAGTAISAPAPPAARPEELVRILPFELHAEHNDPHVRPVQISPPCHGIRPGFKGKQMGLGSPFRAVRLWLAEHGLVSYPRFDHEQHGHGHGHGYGHEHHHNPSINWISSSRPSPPPPHSSQRPSPEAIRAHIADEMTRLARPWTPSSGGPPPEVVRARIEEMIRLADTLEREKQGLPPIIHSGGVKVVTFHGPGFVDGGVRVHQVEGVPMQPAHPGMGLHGHGGWHHRPQSFAQRLQHAAYGLRPAESLALAFVLGAGIGSILHMGFMICLLLSRRFRGRCARGRMTKEERKAFRAARRDQRKQRKMDRKAGICGTGGIRLEGEDEIQVQGNQEQGPREGQLAQGFAVLPAYEAADAKVSDAKV